MAPRISAIQVSSYARPSTGTPRHRLARSTWTHGLAFAAALLFARGADALLISEVMYNPVAFGSDAGQEFVELYNDGPFSILLDDYSLGWGGDDYTFGTLDLDGAGALAPGEYFVVGGPSSPFTFDPELPDGFITAGGVALFAGDAASITATTTPVDALVYGSYFSWNLNGLIDETGNVASVEAIIGAAGESAARDADGSWTTSATPTPGTGPMTNPVPEPSTALLLGLGLAGLGWRRTPGSA